MPGKPSARQYLISFSRRSSVPQDLADELLSAKNEQEALMRLIVHHIDLWQELCKLKKPKPPLKFNWFQRLLMRIGRIQL